MIREKNCHSVSYVILVFLTKIECQMVARNRYIGMRLEEMQFFHRSHDCIFIMNPFDRYHHTPFVLVSYSIYINSVQKEHFPWKTGQIRMYKMWNEFDEFVISQIPITETIKVWHFQMQSPCKPRKIILIFFIWHNITKSYTISINY